MRMFGACKTFQYVVCCRETLQTAKLLESIAIEQQAEYTRQLNLLQITQQLLGLETANVYGLHASLANPNIVATLQSYLELTQLCNEQRFPLSGYQRSPVPPPIAPAFDMSALSAALPHVGRRVGTMHRAS